MKISKVLTATIAALTLAASGANAVSVFADTSASISSTQTETNSLLKQLETANAEVIKLNQQVDDKNASITAANDKIDAATAQIASLSTQITTAENNVVARKNDLKAQLQSLQKQAGDSVSGNVYLDFVLNSKSLTDLVSRSFTVSKLSQASKDALDAVNAAKTKLNGLKDEQVATKQTLESTKASLVSQKAQLAKLQASAQAKSDDLNQQISAHKDELVALQSKFAKEQAAAAAVKTVANTAAASATSTASSTDSSSSNTSSITSDNGSGISTGSGNHADNSSSGNTYPYGQCTWYVKQVAPWAGNNWGNGAEWGGSAAAAGFVVNHTPAAGAIIVFAAGQSVGGVWTADPSYGHVGYVQSVSGNSVTITQGGMGFSSPSGPNTQTISGAGNYVYIHR